MIIPDVNVLIYAHRSDTDQHGVARSWLEDALVGDEGIGLCQQSLLGFYRIVTNESAWVQPTDPALARQVIEGLLASPQTVLVEPDEAFWPIALRLLESYRVVGRSTTDCLFAALAIQHGATLVTCDRGFLRYRELQARLLSNYP